MRGNVVSFPGSGEYMQLPIDSVTRNGGRRVLGAATRVLFGLVVLVAGVAYADSAAASIGGTLYVGGTFTSAGGNTATNVAEWNSVNWSALAGPNGEGTDGQVTAFTTYQGKLIVGGSFLNAGGEVVSGVASWDGTSWQPLVGSSGAIGVAIGPLGFVHSLVVYHGDLYAAGAFPRANGVTVNNIARWNGTDWFPVTGPSGTGVLTDGSTFGAVVWDMTMVDGKLIVAGEFNTAGGVAANSIAAWDGSTWSSVGQPIAGAGVLAVTNHNGRLVASRAYAENNISVNDVVSRDAGTWTALGRFTGNIRDLISYNGLLVAGGQFSQVDSLTVNQVAAWNGSAWSALSGPSAAGTNGDVFALTAHQGYLIVGGGFDQAGGQPAANIARWNGSAWSALPGAGPDGTVFSLLST